MKTIYFIYAVLFKGVSVIRIYCDGGLSCYWVAHNEPQDGYGGYNGKWVESDSPVNAVWKLRSIGE